MSVEPTGDNAGIADTRVLVVDDDPLNTRLLQAIFTAERCQVRSASDAGQALATLAAFVPEVIVVKLELQRIRGEWLTKRLRAHPAGANAVICGVTANTATFDADSAMAAGCDAYLPIPLDTRTLARVVARHLRGRKKNRLAPGGGAP